MNELWKAAGAAAWGAASYGGLLPVLHDEARAAMESLCPNPAGVLVAAFSYYAGTAPGNLSLYCRGRDYHLALRERLEGICGALRLRYPDRRFVPGVDASPVPERQAAELAGIGTRGRHGLLTVPGFGSFVFLGTVLTDLPLNSLSLPEKSPGENSQTACADCSRCVKACPTGALSAEGFDPARCLSHISQKKGALSAQEAAWMAKSPLIWGCDLCQRACPQNENLPHTGIADFREDLICYLCAQDLEGLSNRQFREKYENRAFAWRGLSPLRRNLQLQGNDGAP